ncbi:hypothetical protein D3880_03850 [Pseudomonas cavernae]|uniref:Uncharacterized protein n=1 Tax=Pseudomonas cavernae TaxID=2320867 RepID=A0A385YYS8_9PSED|nr:hypothetical protein D3880_03850 [Pseudomonas cavernae]
MNGLFGAAAKQPFGLGLARFGSGLLLGEVDDAGYGHGVSLGCRLAAVEKNVGEAAETRQKRPKKRSLRAVNEHFEAVFNAVSATQVVFQQPVSGRAPGRHADSTGCDCSEASSVTGAGVRA